LLKLPLPQSKTQTVTYPARPNLNIIGPAPKREFVKVIAVDEQAPLHELYGPYLVDAKEWNKFAYANSIPSRYWNHVRIYHCPPNKTFELDTVNLKEDTVKRKDHPPTNDEGYCPRRLLIPVPPQTTSTKLKQAWSIVTDTSTYRKYARKLATVQKQQNRLNTKKQELSNEQKRFTAKCISALLEGNLPPPKTNAGEPAS